MKRERKQNRSDGKGPVTFETVREIARGLPGAVEGTSYGTPAFRVGKHLFVRQHQDGECLVVRIEDAQRSMRMRADPETFFITDHYVNFPWLLVRLATVDPKDLHDLLEDAWRLCAPPRFLSAYDGHSDGKGAKDKPPPKRRAGQ